MTDKYDGEIRRGNQVGDFCDLLWAMPQAARAGRVSPRAGSRLGHTATIPIANDNEGRG
jgi:hypothetical protein